VRTIAKLAVLPFALVAFGCAKEEPATSTELSADLRKDLELASSAGLDLASSQNAHAQMVVSSIEAGPKAAPVAARPKPRPSAKPKASPTPDVNDAPEVQPSLEPVAEPEAPVVVAASAEPPVAAPRPTAPPIVVPTTGGVFDGGVYGDRDRRGRGGIVIIRGGHAGVDHCERHPRGGGGVIDAVIGAGIGIAVNDRAPGIGIRGRGTFPRY
jgi:hypothetical protein